MSVRVLLAAMLALSATACSTGDAAPDDGPSGTLTLERKQPDQRLLSAPARAVFCGRDSILTLVAVTRGWSFAAGLRTGWPPDTAGSFAVVATPTLAGTAAIAARSLPDTLHPAYISAGGELHLNSLDPLAGRFTFDGRSDSVTAHFTGTFSGLRVQKDKCPE